MANPLQVFLMRSGPRARAVHTRRRVPVPSESPSIDVLFIALRRMRAPIIVLVSIFAISTIGLTIIPGVGEDGRPARLSLFDAFYFVSYTATTIGFGEIAPFTTAQRMWVTLTIYGTVVGWAYGIGKLLTLLQDPMFQEALDTQSFRRKVLRLREPFVIVAGYGQAGRAVCRDLDEAGRRVVIIEQARERLDQIAGDALLADAPGMHGDATRPGVLGLAGLGHRCCEGILAITDDDDVNLAVVMTAGLLRPEVPVIARCHTRVAAERMREFGTRGIINANDRYGDYVVLALHHPSLYRLLTWLLSPARTPLPKVPARLVEGTWVVCADGAFRDEVTIDLERAGQHVVHADAGEQPDVRGAVGFVAGTDQDTVNIALAEHARREAPDIFVTVRQERSTNRSLLRAMGVDSVFTPTDLVATEATAQIVTPLFWTFVEHALERDEEWAQELLARMTQACGRYSPHRRLLNLGPRTAPAAHRWAARHGLLLQDLLRDPEDRERGLAIVPMLLQRGEDIVIVPDPDTRLEPGDRLLLAGRTEAFTALADIVDHDDAVEYVTTGRQVPRTWVWRILTRRRARTSRPVHDGAGARPAGRLPGP